MLVFATTLDPDAEGLGGDMEAFIGTLTAELPGTELALWPDVQNPEQAEFCVAWAPPEGAFSAMPNLKAVLSLGAGVDHIFKTPDLPDELSVIRLIDPQLTENMSEFVVMQALMHHRNMLTFLQQQSRGEWRRATSFPAKDRRIGVMGLGVLGLDALEKLKPFGFSLNGWSRTKKDIPGVQCFAGEGELHAFLQQTDILICLLPLTEETRGILNAELFAALPEGAAVVNVARGEHLDEAALLSSLDSGHLAAATLDVFAEEPLPQTHPFWSHPKIMLTPHIASITHPVSAALAIAAAVKDVRAGRTPPGLVNRAAGY